jgi:hypothetical protein
MQEPAAFPTAILVQGMHASGTSLLSRLVALLVRASRDEGDPFASSAVAGLNRRILQDLGSSWSKPGVLFLRGKGGADSAPLIRAAIRERYRELALGILRSGADRGTVILEDPGLCLLRDLWEAALLETGHVPRTVHVHRNPLEVAASLKESHGLGNARSLQLWVQHNLAALTVAQDRESLLVVPFADVMDPGSGLASRLAAFLDVPPASDGEGMQPAWQRLVEATVREAVVPAQVVMRSPLVPSIVKRLYALLIEWDAADDERRQTAVVELAACFEDQSLFAGNLVQVQLPEAPPQSAPFVSTGGNGTRRLLIHYHLFKNAGTSVDAILRRNFADRWINTEFPPRSQVDHQEAITRFIRDNPHLAAISSHTLMLPVPRIEGVEIFPILFVRHPLDRMRSAYEFERRQDATTIGSRFAREHDFAGYIRARLAIRGDRACRDFHVARLAMAVTVSEGSEVERALAAVERLPFVGLVEAFGASAEKLQQLVQPMFPEFQCFDVWENSTKGRQRTLEERVDDIREELGEECFAMVMDANRADIALHEMVQADHIHRCDNPLHSRLRLNAPLTDARAPPLSIREA